AVLTGAAVAALLAAGCGADTEPEAGPASHPARTTATGSQAPSTVGEQPTAKAEATREAKLVPPLAFHVRRRAQLRSAPGGKVVATVKTKTEFKSPTILAVAARKPGWVMVRTSERKHHVGWLRSNAGVLFSQPR